jgi:hypothetical protein
VNENQLLPVFVSRLIFLKDFSFDGEDYLRSSSQNRHDGFERVTDIIGGRIGYPLH